MSIHVIGVDVGTASVRAGVFDTSGDLVATASREISVHRAANSIVEQSSRNIWQSVSASVRAAVETAGIDPATVAGIGFDATCSLVVVAADGGPLPVGDDRHRDVIVWMDHRALGQARRINSGSHDVLAYVGGVISPEMQTPKLLWLKENRAQTYAAAAHFFDLTDYLTWRASGSTDRSVCTVTCKWTYLAHEGRWDAGYFDAVGLGDLASDDFARIGPKVVDAGTALGGGLTPAAAADLGLAPGTPVAAGLIDAHAGGVGTVGAGDSEITSRLAYVFGTSACTMASTAGPAFVPGVWGPYWSAMVPGYWLSEAGQSAAGAAIDHLVAFHPAASEAAARAGEEGLSLVAWLAEAARRAVPDASDVVKLADGVHVVPEFLGNRAPFADPDSRAVIAGLGMDRSVESLVALYVAGLCGLGYGLRQIIEAQRAQGIATETIMISGGAGQSALVRQVLADTTGLTVAGPRSAEPVMLGSAMLGAVAGRVHDDLPAAMRAMSAVGEMFRPAGGAVAEMHAARYRAFTVLQGAGRQIR